MTAAARVKDWLVVNVDLSTVRETVVGLRDCVKAGSAAAAEVVPERQSARGVVPVTRKVATRPALTTRRSHGGRRLRVEGEIFALRLDTSST